MRRVVPALVLTAAGLAALAEFHTSTTGTVDASASSATTAPTRPGQPSTTAPTVPPKTAPPSTAGSGSGSSANGTRTVTGSVVATRYGDVQVRVTLQGSTIVDVQAPMLPNDRARSASISRSAGPILRQEAVAAQSARIDVVSGATTTSEAYAESLQAALDAAGH